MPTYTYDASEQPNIRIENVDGDVAIEGWDEARIQISSDAEELQDNTPQRDNGVTIENLQDDVVLRVPRGAHVQLHYINGDAAIRDVATAHLTNIDGDTALRTIAGVVELDSINGDLLIEGAGTVNNRGTISGDVRVEQATSASFETVEGDARVRDVPTVRIAHTGGDVAVNGASEGCQLGHVEGDAALHDTGPVTLGHVGGDLAANRVRELRAGDVQGDCAVNGDESTITLGTVHGDLAVRLETGSLQAGAVHGDVAIEGALAKFNLGNTHGDLALRLTPTSDGSYRANVGGDAAISIPGDSNLELHAVVRGNIAGVGSLRHEQHGGVISVTFGSGGARLQLTVGGDLTVRGPASAASSWSPDLGALNEDMAQLGRELGDMGREIAASFKPGVWAGKRGRKGWRAGVGIDPAQREQLKRQVRDTVRSSVEQARSAVQEALRAVDITPPTPPTPPMRPTPPTPATPPTPPTPVTSTSEAMTGATVPLAEQQTAQPDTDAERLAILRMLQEGKITPEEAEELLAELER
jgi:DUF4097 and DUF4098 domain-containing protein YvlB